MDFFDSPFYVLKKGFLIPISINMKKEYPIRKGLYIDVPRANMKEINSNWNPNPYNETKVINQFGNVFTL
jgi:hypothetical protein